MITSKEKSDTRRLPMMPIRDVVIFPHMMTPFVVGRESSVRALEEALAGFERARSLDPRNGKVLWHLADMYMRQRQPDSRVRRQ